MYTVVYFVPGHTVEPRGLVSQSVSTNIYNAQLNRMLHCAPVERKPIYFEFTPEAAVGDIVVGGYSINYAPRQRNFCYGMCCVCVEQRTICR